MAIYHFSMKGISRGQGRSAVAAAAYRSGEKLVDERTGEVYDYERRSGVLYSEVFLPDGGTMERSELWNMAEAAEKRKDAKVAREIVIALPHELNEMQQRALIYTYAIELSRREGWAVDVAMHAPGKEGDRRNTHAHLLCTTRTVERDAAGLPVMGPKTKEWDSISEGPKKVTAERAEWEQVQNRCLGMAATQSRVDCRSYEVQGVELKPTQHMGVHAMAMERRGIPTERGDWNREVQQHNAQVIELAQVRERREDEQAWQQELSTWNGLSIDSLEGKLADLHPGSATLLVDEAPSVKASGKVQHEALQEAIRCRKGIEDLESSLSRARRDWSSQRRLHPYKTFVAASGLPIDKEISSVLQKLDSLPKALEEKLPEAMAAETKLMEARGQYEGAREAATPKATEAYEKRIARYEEAYPLLVNAYDKGLNHEVSSLQSKPYESMYQEVDRLKWGRPNVQIQDKAPGLTKTEQSVKLGDEALQKLSRQEREARRTWETMKAERADWEKQHLVQSFMHNKGVLENKELKTLKEREAWADKAARVSGYSERCYRERLETRKTEHERESRRSRPERDGVQGREQGFKREVQWARERRQEREPQQHQLMLERTRERERERSRGMSR